ncbi:MAG: O-antigen ligase family protein, partial [Clostridia bacterium]|nr:O-antigen ligase family protein [Clostridia bacterium]
LIGFCIVLLVKYWIGVKKGYYTFHKKLVLLLGYFLIISCALSLLHDFYRGAWLYLTYIPFFYFMFAMKNEFKISQGMNYMFGGLLTSVSLAIVTLILPGFQYIAFIDGRFTAFINHPNYLYMRALFIMSYFMYLYLNKNISNAKFILSYLTCSIITLATLSKTGIGMLLLITIIFIALFLKQDFRKNIRIVSLFLIFIALIGLVGFKFIVLIVDRFLDSVSGNDFWNSLLTGRDEIWLCYLKEIFKNPFNFLFGHGLLAEEVFIPSQLEPRASHNLYIFLLYRFGLVGCVAMGMIIYYAFKTYANNKPKLISYLPLIFILIESLFDNTFKCYHFTYFAFAVMIMFMELHEQKQQTIDENEQKNIEKN